MLKCELGDWYELAWKTCVACRFSRVVFARRLDMQSNPCKVLGDREGTQATVTFWIAFGFPAAVVAF